MSLLRQIIREFPCLERIRRNTEQKKKQNSNVLKYSKTTVIRIQEIWFANYAVVTKL